MQADLPTLPALVWNASCLLTRGVGGGGLRCRPDILDYPLVLLSTLQISGSSLARTSLHNTVRSLGLTYNPYFDKKRKKLLELFFSVPSWDRPSPLPSQELDDQAPSLSEGLDPPLFWAPTCVPGFENAQWLACLKAIVNLLIRVNRNSKCICGNLLSLLGAQNEDTGAVYLFAK